MYEDILRWVVLADLVVLVPVLLCVPRAIRLATETDVLKEKTRLLYAEIEMEKLRRSTPAEPEAAKEPPTQ